MKQNYFKFTKLCPKVLLVVTVLCVFSLCGGPTHGSNVLDHSYLPIKLPIIIFILSNEVL